MPTPPGEQPLPNARDRTSWSWLEPPRDGDDPRLVLRVPLEDAPATGPDTASDGGEDDAPRAPSRKRGVPDRLRRLLQLLSHEWGDIDGFDDKDLRYGSERSIALPRLRLKRRKRAGHDQRGRALASYPWLKRLFPRLVSLDEEPEARKLVFLGWRPSSVHVLGKVIDTSYRFRLEDLSRFATHGDHLLHLLEHVDAAPCLDLDAVLYVPSVDPAFPFKFLICANTRADNHVTFVNGLSRICAQTESVDDFLDRFFSEIKLGFEKFGPACATPEFQEVELRLWTLLQFCAQELQIRVGDVVSSMDGPAIRQQLRRVRLLHEAIDECAGLPATLAAFYQTHFNIPFGKLFEHALAQVAEVASSVGFDYKAARPRTIEGLTELVTRFRRLEPADPLENLEWIDARLAASYANERSPERKPASWVRRYEDTIFTGTDKFDPRRYKPLDKKP